jgi:hypothetical protein
MSSGIRLAPSFAKGVARGAALCAAAAVLVAAAYLVEGPPRPSRAFDKTDPPYGPTFPFGAVQFLGQAAILAGAVYVARRWMRVRL